MKDLSDELYQTLTPQERVRAAVAADARNDLDELAKLRVTCPKKIYRMIDAAYSDTMSKLHSLALVNEYELAHACLNFKFAGMLEGMEACDMQESAMVKAASLAEAWDTLIVEMGIDPADMAKSGPPRHYGVEALLKLSEGEADPDEVEAMLGEMRKILAA